MKKLLALLLVLCAVFAQTAFATTYEGMTREEFDALEQTTVIASPDSPTGYYVTFRYKAPDATRVRIYGEWVFSDPDYSTIVTGLNATPDEWQDGYTVWQASGGSPQWPTNDMVLNEETGVWSYTIPLPNGTWNYRFLVGGSPEADITDTTDAYWAYDPNNIPFLADYDEELTTEQYLTSVYVPYDPEKQANSACVEEQAPRDGENGTVFYETAVSSGGIETSYAVYLPYEFDVEREEPYPILVLFHGGGGYDGSWMNNGLVNILDNMIAEGRLEPTIVVTPNGSDFPDPDYSWDRPAIMEYVVNTILPHMTEEYNASNDPARRALGGLSQGGACIMNGYFNNTESFGYYIAMSAPMRGNVYPDYEKEELKDVKLFMGFGLYDHVATRAFYNEAIAANESSTYDYVWGLGQAGVSFMIKNDLPYGHQWALWRELAVYAFDNFLWK